MERDIKIREMPGMGKLATFVPNKALPIYNWFHYKEGFSRDFVFEVCSEFGLSSGDSVLEPFCGSGTVPLACRQLGIDCFGFDVLPIAVFLSRVKTRDYDIQSLREEAGKVAAEKPPKPGVSYSHVTDLVRKSFAPFTLSDILFYRERISEVSDEAAREFLFLALMDSAMKCSLFVKDGSCLKRADRHIPPLREIFRRRLGMMMKDIESFQTMPCRTSIAYGDARRISLPDNSVDAVITSPPYLNKIEYTSVYRIEEDLFFGKSDSPGVRSFVGVDSSKLEARDFEGIGFDMPLSAKPYFRDMEMAIAEFYRVCRPGARVAMVVGDGYIDNQAVDSCRILSEIAQGAGFTANEIVVMNRRVATTPSRRRVGELKECMLLWTKG